MLNYRKYEDELKILEVIIITLSIMAIIVMNIIGGLVYYAEAVAAIYFIGRFVWSRTVIFVQTEIEQWTVFFCVVGKLFIKIPKPKTKEKAKPKPIRLKEKHMRTLGLISLDAKTLKTAYRKKMMTSHPDMGGSTEQAIEVQEAYEYLNVLV